MSGGEGEGDTRGFGAFWDGVKVTTVVYMEHLQSEFVTVCHNGSIHSKMDCQVNSG